MTDASEDLSPQTGLTGEQIAARIDAIIKSASLEEKAAIPAVSRKASYPKPE